MKSILIKILKTFLIFIISTITIYMVFTIAYFLSWANDNQLKLFTKDLANEVPYLDKEKIKQMGDYVGDYAELLEYSLEVENEDQSDAYIIAEHYDPLGFSVWTNLRITIVRIIDRYDTFSIVLGISTTIAYIIITSKNINNIFKIILGYVGPMLIIPPIYTYICYLQMVT